MRLALVQLKWEKSPLAGQRSKEWKSACQSGRAAVGDRPPPCMPQHATNVGPAAMVAARQARLRPPCYL